MSVFDSSEGYTDSSELDDASLTTKFNEVFSSERPDENFAQLLATSERRKFTVLTKAISTKSDDDEGDRRALNILKAVLRLTINTHQISTDELSDVTSCVFTETKHFSNNVLSKIVTHCLEYMKTHQDDDIPTRWIELFGKVVAILSTRTEIKYDDDEYEGKEFRSEVINELCRLNWGARNAPYLISAIREFPGLDNSEVDRIINKAVESIKLLEPSSVPPIAYQLLILATDRKPGVLIQTFDEYFRGMIFDNEELQNVQMQDKKNALGTVVYHFIHAARHSSILVAQIIKRIKNSCDDHSLLMTPFIMSLSLGLLSIDHIKPQVMEILRRSIINSLDDAYNSDSNAWYRSARGEKTDTVTECFKSVIDSKSSELDFLLDGLKDIGLVLLNVQDVQSETHCTVDKCRELGSFIIEAIVKRKTYYFPRVMNELLKTKSSVHIECLASCLRSLIRTIVQSTMSGRINELIHHLPLMTVETATPVIKSLIPAFQLSRNLLDEMIMVVRKTIWKSTEARKISVQAMVLLLSNSRIIGSQIAMSQYSESQTVYTQATLVNANIMPNRNENECLCYELLSILKRFFTQNSEVRERLYLGLTVVARKNPELIGVICSHLLSQVKQHMNFQLTEFRMDKLLDFSSSSSMTDNEDLGLLLQSLSFVTIRGRNVYKAHSEGEPTTLLSCEELLDTWIQLMSRIKLEEIEIAASSALGNGSGSARPSEPVRHVRNAIILQILQTIEALMEYVALRGNDKEDRKMLELFKKFLELEPCLKPPPKPTKKDKDNDKPAAPRKKAKGKDTSKSKSKSKSKNKGNTTSDTASTGTQSSLGSKTKLKPEPPKIFVLVHTINLESILEIVKIFYNSTEGGVLKRVKKQKHFEKFILDVIKQKIERLKKNESLRERDRKIEDVLNTLASIAGALWNASATVDTESSTQMESDEDDEVQLVEAETTSSEVLRFEIIVDLVEFLCTHNSFKFASFLEIFNSDFYVYEDQDFEVIFMEFFRVWTTIVDKYTNDGGSEKILEHLFVILYSFCKCLTPEATDTAKNVLTWCENYAKTGKEITIATRELCGLVIQTILTVGSKLVGTPEEVFPALAMQCLSALGNIVAPDSEGSEIGFIDEQYWLINQETAPVVITTIGLYIERCLGLVTTIIKRLRVQSQYFAVEKLSDLRDKACVMLNFLIKLTTILIRCRFPAGPCVDILQRLLAQVFITTTLLTEHLIEIHSKNNKLDFTARKFATLVKIIGKDFKIRVEGIINHMEGIQREEAEELANANKGGKVPAAMKQKLVKDAKTIPQMVYHVEKYEQQLILLCQKAKVNLLAGTKLSTARDFRIEMNKLKVYADATEKESKKKKKSKNKRTRNSSPEETISDEEDDDGNRSSVIHQSGLSRINRNNDDDDDDNRPARSAVVNGLSKKRRRT